MPPKSILWKHFIKTTDGAKCNVCQQFIKTCGNTTNLRYHLQRKHPDLYIKIINEESRKRKEMSSDSEVICEEEQDDVEERDESMLSPTPSTSTSSTSSCVNSSKSKKQPKLKDIFVKQKSFQDGGSKASDITA
ncbi:uncharacterized protein LOC105193876 isoform X2 [Solenopsis invicta]|uniref:uncharacterized protein LOC105193876 isoform X2 n=1 Tax=Solenopsis invicta TaxID=13686 RepID=UPI000E33F6BA|nr:uncharacterized protein LOC105193876 isoform X2 [Solenopsis invicta]